MAVPGWLQWLYRAGYSGSVAVPGWLQWFSGCTVGSTVAVQWDTVGKQCRGAARTHTTGTHQGTHRAHTPCTRVPPTTAPPRVHQLDMAVPHTSHVGPGLKCQNAEIDAHGVLGKTTVCV